MGVCGFLVAFDFRSGPGSRIAAVLDLEPEG